jgi:hypothetical protein
MPALLGRSAEGLAGIGRLADQPLRLAHFDDGDDRVILFKSSNIRDRLASKDCDMGTLLLLDVLGAPKDATSSPLAPYHLKHARRPGKGNANFCRAIAFRHGASSKLSRRQKAKPMALWLAMVVDILPLDLHVRAMPQHALDHLIIAATSEDEHRLSCEQMQVEPFSTCQ